MAQLNFFKTLDDLINQADTGQVKVIEAIKRAGLNNSKPTQDHITAWMNAQGVTLESLAHQDATAKIMDLIIELYLNRAN